MNKNSFIYLRDIKNAITSIEKFIEDMNFDQFHNDDKTSSAVIRKFEIIGEATKNIHQRKVYSNTMERYCWNER